MAAANRDGSRSGRGLQFQAAQRGSIRQRLEQRVDMQVCHDVCYMPVKRLLFLPVQTLRNPRIAMFCGGIMRRPGAGQRPIGNIPLAIGNAPSAHRRAAGPRHMARATAKA